MQRLYCNRKLSNAKIIYRITEVQGNVILKEQLPLLMETMKCSLKKASKFNVTKLSLKSNMNRHANDIQWSFSFNGLRNLPKARDSPVN